MPREGSDCRRTLASVRRSGQPAVEVWPASVIHWCRLRGATRGDASPLSYWRLEIGGWGLGDEQRDDLREFMWVVRRALYLVLRWIERRYGWKPPASPSTSSGGGLGHGGGDDFA